LQGPYGVALDESGGVFIADTGDNAIKEWVRSTDSLNTLSCSGLNQPFGVVVDATGNVYIADGHDRAIKEWLTGTQQLITVIAGDVQGVPLNDPQGVALDAAGESVYLRSRK
jgi:DNA-binding beta-propeller fold protein YncE